MKTLLRLSKLIAPLFPVMLLAVIFGTAGFLCAISIPSLGVLALFEKFPVKNLFVFKSSVSKASLLNSSIDGFLYFSLL